MKGAPQVRPASAGGGAAPLLVPRRQRAEEAHEAQAVPVDRRIAARRRAVAEEETRRRIRRLLWLAGPVALIAVVLGITRTPLLDVDHVVVASAPVEGVAELSPDEQAAVQEALTGVDLARGEPLVDVDLRTGEEALEALPWVDRAEVARRWPGTLEVEVLRRVPVGAVATAGGAALVDRTGQVVAVVPADGAPAAGLVTGLVEVEGPGDLVPGAELDALDLLAVAELVPEALVPMVARVGDGEGPAVVLHLRDGGTVDLGPPLGPADVADKLHAAVTMLTQVDRTCLQVLDVSVPTVPTVTRVPGC